MSRKKLHIMLLIIVTLLAVYPIQSVAASWAEPIYDAGVPAKIRENVAKAIDTTADLLVKYKIALPKEIKVIVSADFESYVQAYMFYTNTPRAKAEEYCKTTGGLSLGGKPIVLIRGPVSPGHILSVVPHELFHQVQNQYGKADTVAWLKEGTPEMFEKIALEADGVGKVDEYMRHIEQKIRKAPAIPDVREFINYTRFQALRTQQGYPVYDMSAVMTYRLIADNGFENIIFFYQLLHNGTAPNKAFVAAFRVPMSWFLADMNTYFEKLRSGK